MSSGVQVDVPICEERWLTWRKHLHGFWEPLAGRHDLNASHDPLAVAFDARLIDRMGDTHIIARTIRQHDLPLLETFKDMLAASWANKPFDFPEKPPANSS